MTLHLSATSDGGTKKFFGDDQVETAAGKWGPSTPVEQIQTAESSYALDSDI